MTINIDDPEIERLASALATHTGETPTQALITALRERLEREEHRLENTETRVQEILAIGRRTAALSIRDPRSAEEIIGYDEYGVPR